MMDEIVELIKKTFYYLWKVKRYGKTIEIITPSFTTNDCFVSVFLTKRDKYYIVTDGGWISEKYYNNFLHTCQVSTLFAGFTEAVLLQFPGPAAGTRIKETYCLIILRKYIMI